MTTNDIASLFLLDFQRMVDQIDYARSSEVRRYVGHYPPVDIVRKDNNWVIQMALAGYSEDELEITTEENTLIVKGAKAQNSDPKLEYIFKGISSKEFERRWQLDNDMEVVGTAFENGMLTIGITKIVPEAKKPKKLKIGTSADSLKSKLLTIP